MTKTVGRKICIQNKQWQCFTLLLKTSLYEIKKKIGILGTGTRNKKVDSARNRLFRVSIMSCACLLMNTVATVAVSVGLEEWSLSSDLWLKCHTETSMTRNWANYGMHVGDRYSCLLWPARYLLVLIDCCLIFATALQGTKRTFLSTRPWKQQTVDEGYSK